MSDNEGWRWAATPPESRSQRGRVVGDDRQQSLPNRDLSEGGVGGHWAVSSNEEWVGDITSRLAGVAVVSSGRWMVEMERWHRCCERADQKGQGC